MEIEWTWLLDRLREWAWTIAPISKLVPLLIKCLKTFRLKKSNPTHGGERSEPAHATPRIAVIELPPIAIVQNDWSFTPSMPTQPPMPNDTLPYSRSPRGYQTREQVAATEARLLEWKPTDAQAQVAQWGCSSFGRALQWH